jgi:hypothetical protein
MTAVLRSVLAVLGGYLTMATVVMLGTGAIKMLSPSWVAAEGAPTAPYLVINVAYSFIAALTGGYVAAWIASRLFLLHAIALGAFVLVMTIISAVLYENRQPRWYQVLLGVLMPLAVVLGGWVRARKS